ncbi:MAG: bifunctional riboflavin kinase/FAD synthetase [Gammaproteobacteria bacterium]|mgnify:FL=1|nr:MAG: bifunctional riboflavin kinase/FAD synthetase [Gammaproteobacteria bacterium]
MHLIRSLKKFKHQYDGCVATIGNFDGVHLGHQKMMRELKEKGKELNLPVVVITFEPHPKDYFVPQFAPSRICRLRDKLVFLRDCGIDFVYLVRFTHNIAHMKAEKFIDDILVGGLGIRYLVVGDDFRFGAAREGDFDLLVSQGQNKGFTVSRMPTYPLDGCRVSSSRIRACLMQNDIGYAAKLLGREYSISGRVRHGLKLGRKLEFPTANIGLPQMPFPLNGVYFVRVYGLGDKVYPAVANVGCRPTVDGTLTVLEVHILEFDEDIYGRYIRVGFLHFLRPEQKFDSVDELREQIEQDVAQSKKFFNLN